MCNSCGDKLWRWSCLHVSIFGGPVVHESWPLQRTLGRCQLQGLSLTGMTKSLSFSHFPLFFLSFTVKCVYIYCAWSHALKITLVKNFFKFWYFHTILYQYGLVISLAVFHDFLHSFTPGLFCHSASNDFFCFISHLACFATLCILWVSLFHTWPISYFADPEVLWLWGRRMPGRGQVCGPAGGRTQIFNAKGQVWGILCRVHSGTYFILILM